MLIDVGSYDEFTDRKCQIVMAGDTEVGVIRWGDQLYAVRNTCADQGGPVCSGPLRPLLSYDEHDTMLLSEEERPVLSCPWHHWMFDVATGRNIQRENSGRLRVYPIKEENGRILVDLGPAATSKASPTDT
jgi:nitrite reductase/ring-hydroxylating ferredoxin subunit